MNFEERKAEILRRSEVRLANRRRNRKLALSVSGCALTLALLALPLSRLGAPAMGEETMKENAPAFTVAENLSLTVDSQGQDSNSLPTTEDIRLVINSTPRGAVTADIDAQFTGVDPQNEAHRKAFQDFTHWPLDRLLAALPVSDPQNARVSAVLAWSGPESRDYTLHDYVLEYTGADGEHLRIALSPVGAPLRCVVYQDKNVRPSSILGVEVIVQEISGAYYAGFCHAGLYFDIETQSIPQ